MSRMTIKGLDDELMKKIRDLAKREGSSLNRTAIKLIRRGAGLPDGKVGHSLDHLFESMSREEADELNAVIEEECERIDEEVWC